MDPQLDNGNNDYDVFKQESGESIEVAEEKPAIIDNAAMPDPKRGRSKRLRNIIFILAGAIAIVALILGVYALSKRFPSKKPVTNVTINTQTLDNGTLNELTATNGEPASQQLTITPDTLFKNNVTIEKDLTVKGQTFLQSPVTINKDLAVGGNVGLGGNLSVNGRISAGDLSVGSITISSLSLSGNLKFDGHFTPTGALPTIKPGIAAGGGTAKIDGNDTAGTITITTGGSTSITGELATITFRTQYTGTPKVHLTPVSAASSKLDYFVTHSAGFFTVETTSVTAAGTTYSFDYLVTQ
jgi:hypothetical protein